MNATNDQLKVLYEAWNGEAAAQVEIEAAKTEPEYMVVVTRHVGRHIKRSEYLFATEEIANACKKYWQARGGLVTLAVCKVVWCFGYVEEPTIYM